MPSQKKNNNKQTEKNKQTKTPVEFLKLNIRLLNKLSRAKYEYLQSQKKSTKFSTNRIIWTIIRCQIRPR